jgi:diaminopimelate decarboxylase
MVDFIGRLRGKGINLEYLNIGGGLGIIYNRETPQSAQTFASRILPLLEKTGLKIILEPGRFIAGQSGILVTKVLYIKSTPKKKFIIVDAGMNDLIRPALYDAYHEILPLAKSQRQKANDPPSVGTPRQKCDIVGPICESADCFAKDRKLPEVKEGEFLAIMSAGAYGFSMASNYNSRTRAEELMVVRDRVFVIRKRESREDLVRNEIIPPFLLGL